MKLLLKYSFFLLAVGMLSQTVKAQEWDYLDKLPFEESKAYLKKAAFVEDISYATYDLYFQRMEWSVDPSILHISGSVTSYFKPLSEDLSAITFDLDDNMQVDSIHYHNTQIGFTHESDKIRVQLPAPINEDSQDSITVWYQGEPTSSGFGAFATNTTSGGNPVLWTLSEPYGAKEWWPCKQSLSDKIDSIEIRVTCPAGNKVASNGKLISEETQGEETTVVWKHHYPITTYLVAIAVTNYSAFSNYLELDDGSQLEILNYVYPEYLGTAQNLSAETLEIMRFFNDIIGEYPFADEKYGHAQFGWGGGMEHQTMSFMHNLNFGLVAHEMAHQWFGDCITLGSWHDIWLNEGFATYMTGLTYENLLDGIYWDNWKRQQATSITAIADGSVYVEDTTSVSQLFSSRLSYAKGGYLLHMLRWELGDDAFFTALQNYYNDPAVKYEYASQQEWVSHLEAAGDTSLTEFFNDWYYGEGYPSYQINYYTDYSDNGNEKMTITQTTSDESVDFFEMHLPLRIWKDGSSKNIRLHQTKNPQTFVLEEKPDSVYFDPDLWLISKNSLVTEVVELTMNEMKIFPNPATIDLTIQLNSGEQITDVLISDITGKKVAFFENPATNKINIANLPEGIYLIRIETNKSINSSRFVIKR